MGKMLTAIGLMSGTSMDGIDAAIIRTDGVTVDATDFQPYTQAYDPVFRQQLKMVVNDKGQNEQLTAQCENRLTQLHAEIVKQLLQLNGLTADQVDLIGFHGHTILHVPDKQFTRQLGNGPLLAQLTGINVVYDFRSHDVSLGGQGAPLVPVYHRAITHTSESPLAVLNIGGVANVTWLGEADALLAFDTGPGNALMDDWVHQHTGEYYDKDGLLARQGKVHSKLVAQWMAHDYFKQLPPKSLDRHSFVPTGLEGLSLEDGAASLLAFTVQSIAKAAEYFPKPAKAWYIAGGGRHNHRLMEILSELLNVPIMSIDQLGYDGDALEAQAFAFLAVRSQYGLPLTYPGTTGVRQAAVGGVFCLA